MKALRAARMERCIGCHSCSLACSRQVHHFLSWNRAGIRIASAGGLSTGFEAKVCLACHPAPCAEACPSGALVQRRDGGVMQKKSLCVRCGLCAEACPVDAIYLDSENNPYVCIHCGQCVAFCPHNCLEMADLSPREKDGEADHD
ncbi:4Fe-4S dicluster domain-containing protein [Pseudodesulfovibrio cashew]|uniref:4Fe-4S dicluster domain-containing protein n=1 Tax=Pseudodesulfovibrio cashew TaxID=2678688 RepID=A0A6I6JDN9_9BACT|nr:4Fe-4S binding protein [Pseudodesulfovibrio cashew]QGY39289.1 4Fe-4S dicluster domain-containing protein [Pseudodesulfovibrio cashew]